jgi:tRNA A-37 threonylcarbamoyl transferase component Bud32/tetratricopeptide (TPR) repeat protein
MLSQAVTVDVSSADCPTADELAGYVAGERIGDVLAHLDACAACRRAVSALAAVGVEHAHTLESGEASRRVLDAGTRVGRFTLARVLGEGAMGEVWAARDPELDREVAIKLLRVTPERLRREAQAMARVKHGNVVAIYDLGVDGDHAFCAMELVDGITLRAWLQMARPWRAVVAVAIAAGRGLAAAHAAGLIHRDVKPENVLIASDGRTLVTDFGLAKLAGPDEEAVDISRAVTEGADVSTRLTVTGALVGTPAYMSPEQLASEPADARSDQFSYCVMIYEALFRARPFEARNIGELRDAIRTGIKPRADLRGVPRRLAHAIERGLAHDPAARWPSMDALLAELERATRRRRWWIAALPAAIAATAVTVYLANRGGEPNAAEAHAAAERKIAAAWSSERAKTLHVGFTDSGGEKAGDRAATVVKVLDKYRTEWLAARDDAWAATHVRGEQTVELLERRLACFDRLADAMGEVVTLLAKPTAGEVKRAAEIVVRLEPIANCSNERRLAAKSLAPSSKAGHDAALTLRQIEALQVMGRQEEALRRAEALVDSTATLGDPMLHARARYNFGVALSNAGRFEDAERVLKLAVQSAAGARDHYMVASAWLRLLSLVGLELGRPKEAANLEPAARAAVAQAGDDPKQVAELAFTLGLVAYGAGDLAAARDHMIDARDRRIAIHGADHPIVASMESNLGAMLMGLGELDEATRVLDHARSVAVSKLPPKHPLLAQIELNRGGVAARRNDWPASEAALRVGLDADLAVRGPSHPETIQLRSMLARALREQRRFGEAREQIELARAGLADASPAMPEKIELDVDEARILKAEDKWADAEKLAKRAVDAFAKSTARAAKRAAALELLAEIVAHRSPRDALAIYDEAFTVHTSQPSRDQSGDAESLAQFANVALAAKRPAIVLAWFDKLPEAAKDLTDLRAKLERAR